jgi:hypothetical protein
VFFGCQRPGAAALCVGHDSSMNASDAKLMIGLVLLAAGAILMCVGTRALFFLGLALVVISGSLSLRPRASVGWLRRLAGWAGCLGAVVLFLWLSSSGREAVPWAGACAGVFAVAMTEFDHWRASRRAPENA